MTRLEQILDNDLSRFAKDSRSKHVIMSTITRLKCDPNRVVKASGSGESLILIFPRYVMKIFPDDHDITHEATVLRNIRSDNIITGIEYSKRPEVYIIYERLEPIRNIYKPNEDQLVHMLCNVAIGLYDLHRHGYVHGDVAIGNIGRDTNGNYVLYDLETAKRTSSSRERFRDVEMFLEDLEIQYKKWPELQGVVSHILHHLRNTYRTVEIVMVKGIGGKKRRREIYTYHYDIHGVGRALSGFCN